MNAARLLLSLSAMVFLAITGCSTPCESVCSSFNECEIDQRAYKVDCPTFCGRVDELHASSGDTCKTEFDKYISCWETNIADICNAENKSCDADATAWVDCMAKFCAIEANATNKACVPQAEGPALPALKPF